MRTFLLFLFAAITNFPALSQALYGSDYITTIEIVFQTDDWHQALNDLQAAGNGGRLLASVAINGVPLDSAGVRYRGGNTSDPSNAKNPLNIKLDFMKNQDFQGYRVLKLSNGAKDPSWLREVLSFEIARNYMEAPKANYASVFVNGNFLGLYANVESINSKFFSERFLSDAGNTRLEGNPSYGFDEILAPPNGCAEGHGAALENLGLLDACYSGHYKLQSNTGWGELRELALLLENDPQNLRSLMDEDRFIWMSAFNNLLANLHSYLGASPRNYFIFKADNGHWVPAIEDLNESFGRFPWLSIPAAGDPQPPLSFFTELDLFQGENDVQKPLLKALFSDASQRKKYVAHLRTMIGEMFTSGWFEQRAEALQNLIDEEVASDGNHFYTHDEFIQNFENTLIDSYDGEDAYGLFPLMDGRIAYLLGLPEFQAAAPVITGVSALPAMPSPGTPVNITASISNGNSAILGHRNNRKEMFELLPMADDGNHGDGTAGDGVFGATLTLEAGGLQYYIYAENSGAGIFSPERAEFDFYEINNFGAVHINELMAANETAVSDQDGEFDDWAEIYNGSSTPVDLSGWFLSDDPQNPAKWAFPNGSFIDPDGYLTVWADNDVAQEGLHASFGLSANGEQLLLTMPNGTVADQVFFGTQAVDRSYARCPNGSGDFMPSAPTFGTDNNSECTTATDDLAEKNVLKIYPNPASDMLFIETNLRSEIKGKLRSAVGRVARGFQFTGSGSVDLSGLPQGLYFLEIEGGGVAKVVKR
ncbi:MAG TPA: T9SS type A sorting domain-containing protein [Bacteroidetes bacterium]|nr:T9SS type A sorting domain-containing protein [Bacteroidota bacterium]